MVKEAAGRRFGVPWAVAWGTIAVVARAPFVWRAEGMLDHDQSVVGLMALDVAAGRRFPIFFDGQRYMGAVEPYIAAAFVRLLGHAPWVVALAPLLCASAFVAGQYAVWSRWRGKKAGHLAALFATLAPPMFVLWEVVPRGGYAAHLAWVLPTLWGYRAFVRRGELMLAPGRQAAWGFWLGLGYFINPLALTVYATIALDWTFGRHGAELREQRGLDRFWPRSALAVPAAFGVLIAASCLLAAACHVDPRTIRDGSPYMPLLGVWPGDTSRIAGTFVVLVLCLAIGRWTGLLSRSMALARTRPWGALGFATAWLPFGLFGVLLWAGVYPPTPSLPMWIGAPWKAGPNIETLIRSLGLLVGSDPRAVVTVLGGQGIAIPGAHLPGLHQLLVAINPLCLGIAGLLLLRVIAATRRELIGLTTLTRDQPASPAGLAILYFFLTISLFLIQGMSPDASSVRYLVPLGAILPGLLALGILGLPRYAGVVLGAALVLAWTVASVEVWGEIGRESPARPLVVALQCREVRCIVAPTPVALMVANLSSGSVGAVEFRPLWPRLGNRYQVRLARDAPIICVTDRLFPWSVPGAAQWAERQDLARHLRALEGREPGSVRNLGTVGTFDIWCVDRPLEDVLRTEPDDLEVAESRPHS